MINGKKRAIGISFLLMALLIGVVSAYVYETGNVAVSQTVKNIATLTVQNSALGDIEEGQNIDYTKATVASLGNIFTLTTTKDDVYLHFNSDIDSLGTYYSIYTITVKYAAVGASSAHSVGDVACTMTLLAPDPSDVILDKLGSWAFDYEISTTAKSVSSDQATSATTIVTAEST